MTAHFDLVTLDSPEPNATADFWAAALGLHEVEREDGDRWIVLADDHEVRRIGIQRGAVRSGSVHLDVACSPSEFDGELARLLGLGAIEVAPARREPYGSIVNLTDPYGSPFDLCAYL